MKKILFLCLMLMPFTMKAAATSTFEVIDKYDDVVYVIEERNFEEVLKSCSKYDTIDYNDLYFMYEISTENNLFMMDYDSGSIYIYDVEKGTCTETTRNSVYKEYEDKADSFRVTEYYVEGGKLYQKDFHPYLDYGYVLVDSADIDVDGGKYYTRSGSNYTEVADNTVCTTGTDCYEKKLFYDAFYETELKDDVTYYIYDSNNIYEIVTDNTVCESDVCYYEVKEEDFSETTELTKIDMSKFDFAGDGLDTTDIIITSYIKFNNVEYIVVDDGNSYFLYKLDGTMVIPTTYDGGAENDIVVADGKYLVNVNYVNDTSFKVVIYDSNFNVIYEKNYDHSGAASKLEGEYFYYLLSYGNVSSLEKWYYSDDLVSGDQEEKVLTFNIRDYRLLEGKGQTFTDKDLTFKTNGDIDRLDKVLVDGKEIKEYTKASGSTIITLDKEYLSTLTVGKHTLRIAYNDGGYVDTEFNVKAVVNQTSNQIPAIPMTPDTSDNIMLYISLFGICVLSMFGVNVYYKKMN